MTGPTKPLLEDEDGNVYLSADGQWHKYQWLGTVADPPNDVVVIALVSLFENVAP